MQQNNKIALGKEWSIKLSIRIIAADKENVQTKEGNAVAMLVSNLSS